MYTKRSVSYWVQTVALKYSSKIDGFWPKQQKTSRVENQPWRTSKKTNKDVRRYRSFFLIQNLTEEMCVQMNTDVKATGTDKSEELKAKK